MSISENSPATSLEANQNSNFILPPSSPLITFRCLGNGKISTPRLVETDYKSRCFGFDDNEDDEDVQLLSPVKIIGSPKYFDSPYSAKPQRFNLSLLGWSPAADRTELQEKTSKPPISFPQSILDGGKKVDENSKNDESFTSDLESHEKTDCKSIENRENVIDIGNVPTPPKRRDEKKKQKEETKSQKSRSQPLILDFLFKETSALKKKKAKR